MLLMDASSTKALVVAVMLFSVTEAPIDMEPPAPVLLWWMATATPPASAIIAELLNASTVKLSVRSSVELPVTNDSTLV